jgi:hypothetical protein
MGPGWWDAAAKEMRVSRGRSTGTATASKARARMFSSRGSGAPALVFRTYPRLVQRTRNDPATAGRATVRASPTENSARERRVPGWDNPQSQHDDSTSPLPNATARRRKTVRLADDFR